MTWRNRMPQNRLREVDTGKPVAVHLPIGAAVRVMAGQVWLTQEGLSDDYILSAGEHFEVRHEGLIVFSATDGSALVYYGAADKAGSALASPGFGRAVVARARELRRRELACLARRALRFAWRALRSPARSSFIYR
jgi:hypothetical protein